MGPVSDEMTITSLEQFLGVWQIINIDEREFIATHILLLGKNAFKDVQLGQKAGFIMLEQFRVWATATEPRVNRSVTDITDPNGRGYQLHFEDLFKSNWRSIVIPVVFLDTGPFLEICVSFDVCWVGEELHALIGIFGGNVVADCSRFYDIVSVPTFDERRRNSPCSKKSPSSRTGMTPNGCFFKYSGCWTGQRQSDAKHRDKGLSVFY